MTFTQQYTALTFTIRNPIIADAILDRLSRKRYHIKLRGESMRRSDASFDSL